MFLACGSMPIGNDDTHTREAMAAVIPLVGVDVFYQIMLSIVSKCVSSGEADNKGSTETSGLD